jgi:N12 class adenine-specific DNA methylase
MSETWGMDDAPFEWGMDDTPAPTATEQPYWEKPGESFGMDDTPYSFDPDRAKAYLYDQARDAAFFRGLGNGQYDTSQPTWWMTEPNATGQGLPELERTPQLWHNVRDDYLRQFPDADEEKAQDLFFRLVQGYRASAALHGDTAAIGEHRQHKKPMMTFKPQSADSEETLARLQGAYVPVPMLKDRAKGWEADDQSRALMASTLVDYAERRSGKDARSFSEKVATRFGRGEARTTENVRASVREFTPLDRWMLGQKGADEFKKKERYYEELRSIVRGVGDPADSDSWLLSGFLGAVEMSPPIIDTISINKLAGPISSLAKLGTRGSNILSGTAQTAYWWTQMAPGIKNKMLEEGINEKVATGVSAVAAVPIAMIENLQIKGLRIPLPSAVENAMKQRATAYVLQATTQAAIRSGKQFAVEWGEEALQSIGESTAVYIGSLLDEQHPGLGREWLEKEGKEFLKEMGQAGTSLPWLMLPGAVVDTAASAVDANYRKRHSAEISEFLRTPKGAGIFAILHPEAAENIIANPSRSNVADQTGTRRGSWGVGRRRDQLVEGLKAGLAAKEKADQEQAKAAADEAQAPAPVQTQEAPPAPAPITQPAASPPLSQPTTIDEQPPTIIEATPETFGEPIPQVPQQTAPATQTAGDDRRQQAGQSQAEFEQQLRIGSPVVLTDGSEGKIVDTLLGQWIVETDSGFERLPSNRLRPPGWKPPQAAPEVINSSTLEELLAEHLAAQENTPSESPAPQDELDATDDEVAAKREESRQRREAAAQRAEKRGDHENARAIREQDGRTDDEIRAGIRESKIKDRAKKVIDEGLDPTGEHAEVQAEVDRIVGEEMSKSPELALVRTFGRDNMPEVLAIIDAAPTTRDAVNALVKRFGKETLGLGNIVGALRFTRKHGRAKAAAAEANADLDALRSKPPEAEPPLESPKKPEPPKRQFRAGDKVRARRSDGTLSDLVSEVDSVSSDGAVIYMDVGGVLLEFPADAYRLAEDVSENEETPASPASPVTPKPATTQAPGTNKEPGPADRAPKTLADLGAGMAQAISENFVEAIWKKAQSRDPSLKQGGTFEQAIAKAAEAGLIDDRADFDELVTALRRGASLDAAGERQNAADALNALAAKKKAPKPSIAAKKKTDLQAAIEELREKYGVDIDILDELLLSPEQQKAADFARSLGAEPIFVRFPEGSGFRGFAKGRTILIDADASAEFALWYLIGHEVAHSTGLDKLDVPEATLKRWLADYAARIQKGTAYERYWNAHPEYHSREALAHMFGMFLSSSDFRNSLEAEDPSLWRRIARAILKFFGVRKVLPEVRTALDAIRARMDAVAAENVETTVSKPATERPARPVSERGQTALVGLEETAREAEARDRLAGVLERAVGEFVTPEFMARLRAVAIRVPELARKVHKGYDEDERESALIQLITEQRPDLAEEDRTDAYTPLDVDFLIAEAFEKLAQDELAKLAKPKETTDARTATVGDAVLGSGDRQPGSEPSGDAAPVAGSESAGVAPDADGGSGTKGARKPSKRQPRVGRRGSDSGGDSVDDRGGKPGEQAEAATGTDGDDVEAFQREDSATPKSPRDADPNRVNHRIGPDDVLLVAGPGAKKTRAQANIAAIRLLKQLEAEGREATPEEKRILAQYVGWGGLKPFFNRIKGGAYTGKHSERLRDEAWERAYGKTYKELRELLTDEEWDAAASSTQNAHYTARGVIEAMWRIAERVGFKGGKVWEPAAGVGHFFGLMPERYVGNTKFIASERDSISARITAKLYPQAKVMHSALENLQFPNNTIDLAISNVPFSRFKPAESTERYGRSLNLHNYFLARMIDAVRPGGFVIAISTFRTMDAQTEMRKFLAGKANLVGAIRLPNNAFKENADTEIPTDIIILQKPLTSNETPDETFGALATVETVDGPTQVNEYFVRHPEMVLGEHSLQGTMYGTRKKDKDAEALQGEAAKEEAAVDEEFASGEYTVMPKAGKDLGEQLSAAVEALPEDLAVDGAPEPEAFNFSSLGEAGEMKENSLHLVDGRIAVVVDGKYDDPVGKGFIKAADAKTLLKRAKDYVELRDAYKGHLQLMLSTEATDAQVEESRKKLEEMYDRYHKRHDMLHGNKTKPFNFDPDFYLLRGLERLHVETIADKKGNQKQKAFAKKSDVLLKRTLYPPVMPTTAATLGEAVRLSSMYRGTLDLEYVANLVGKDVETAAKELPAEGHAFRDPISGVWHSATDYLSGNVREKLRQAEAAAKDDPAYKPNAEALRKVQPATKPMAKIKLSIASVWIPADVHEQFLREELTIARPVVKRAEVSDEWSIEGEKHPTNGAKAEAYGTKRKTALQLYVTALNMRQPSVFDVWRDESGEHRRFNAGETAAAQAKMEALNDRFAAWVKGKKELHPRLEEIFNNALNAFVLPAHDDSDLPLPGASTAVKLRRHQMRAIRRFIADGHGLIAHAVGAGKTFEMVAIAQESKRLGIAKKPLIVVQNATLKQFAASYQQLYPAANVLVATDTDLKSDKRQAFLAKMVANDYDAVIMAQSSFDLIPVSIERQMAYIRSLIEELEAAIAEEQAAAAKERGGKRRGKSDLEQQLDKLRDRMQALTDKLKKRAEKLLTFEDLGIDLLMIDEAHAYKKPPFVTKLQRIVGLNKSTSQRAFNMLLKARFVQEKRNGKGVILATGTPITNTMGEAFHLMNISSPHILKEYGVDKFDRFVSVFAQQRPTLTMNAGGRFVYKTALHSWQNKPQLRKMLRLSWDIITTAQLREMFGKGEGNDRVELPKLKGGKPTIMAVPITPAVQKVKDLLRKVYDRFAAMEGEAKREHSWIPLVTYGLARAAALDVRLVYDTAPDDPGSKVNVAVGKAVEIYKRTAEQKGTQLIFCDSFNPVRTHKLIQFLKGEDIDLDLDEREEIDTDEGTVIEGEDGKKDDKVPFLYDQIRKKLIAKGIPAEEIAIITEANTDARRESLFNKVKAGEVRFLIGSTAKMGVGVNVQDRLAALHHLDAPWLPADLEQREGRILRQGNVFAALGIPVEVLAYGMTDTLDAGLYTSILRKAQNIEGALSSTSDEDESEDDPFSGSIPSYQEQMAVLAGDPRLMEKLEKTEALKSLEMERESFQDQKTAQAETLERMEERKASLASKIIPQQKKLVAALPADENAENITGAVNGKKAVGASELGKLIDEAVKSKAEKLIADMKAGTLEPHSQFFVKTKTDVAPYVVTYAKVGAADITVLAYAEAKAKENDKGGLSKEWQSGIAVRIYVNGIDLYNGSAQTGRGIVDGYLAIREGVAKGLERYQEEATKLDSEIPQYEELIAQPFPKAAQIREYRERVKEIDDQLAAEGAAEEAKAKQRGRSAAEDVQKEADEGGEETDAMGFGPGGGRVRVKQRLDAVPDSLKAPDKEVERRMRAAHGLSRQTFWQRQMERVKVFWRKATRAQEFLPKEFDYENEWFRLLKEIPRATFDETARTVGAIVEPLGPKQLDLFERKLMMENLIAAHDRGEPLRFGWKDRKAMTGYLETLDEAITSTPEVQHALDRRTRVITELVEELVKYDLIGEEALENSATYFHHQVLSKYDSERAKGGATKANPVKRAFQRARVKGAELGEEFDVNTDFIEAEMAWMYEARVELAKAKKLRDLAAKRDLKPELKQEAKRRNFVEFVGGEAIANRIAELEGLIAESRFGDADGNAGDPSERKPWIEELEQIDPTRPYKIAIAKARGDIEKLWRNGAFDAGRFEDALKLEFDEDTDEIADIPAGWFRFLSWAAANLGDESVGIAAKAIFKAIQERKKAIADKLGDKLVSWRDLVPEGHELWQPEPGNYFYEAIAIPDKIAEQIQVGMVEGLQLSADDLQTVLAMAGPKKQLVLRSELVEQLRAAEKPKPASPIADAAKAALSWWKGYQQFKPTNYVANSLRNLLGDLEAAVGSNPGIAKEITPELLRELRDYYGTFGGGQRHAMSPELRAARDLGVLNSGMQAVELPDVNLLDTFARFYRNDASVPAKLVGGLAKAHQTFQPFREAVVRYAAFKFARKGLFEGTLTNFGGAKKETVRALVREMGLDAAAAHFSRNLLGDYSNLTVMDAWLRDHLMPFWSFQAINLRRFPRMLLNAIDEGQTKGRRGGRKAAVLIGGQAARATIFAGLAAMRYGWLIGLLAAWNWFRDDEEDDLSDFDRARPHINLGRNPDGTVRVLRGVSALGDLMEYLGINTLLSLADDVADDRLTWGEAIDQASTDPLKKLVSGIGPQYKLPVEVGMGRSLFPDPFNPRRMDRDEVLASGLGMRDEYLAGRGMLYGEGDRGRPGYMQRVFGMAVVDPRENAMQEAYALRDRYLKREGKDVPSGDPNFRNMRLAAATNDPERFAEARKAYLKSGKSWKNFEQSLARLDPIDASMKGEDEEKFIASLTPVQRNRLDVARRHAHDMEVWMRSMWRESADEVERSELDATITKSAFIDADTLAEPKPLKLSSVAAWRERGERAAAQLRMAGYTTPAELRSAYARYLMGTIKDPQARAARLARFTNRFRQLEETSK